MQNQETQIESLSDAIQSLVVIRGRIAEGKPIENAALDEAMKSTGRGFNLLWDLRYNRKGGA